MPGEFRKGVAFATLCADEEIARLQQEMAEMQDELDTLRRLLGLSLAPLSALPLIIPPYRRGVEVNWWSAKERVLGGVNRLRPLNDALGFVARGDGAAHSDYTMQACAGVGPIPGLLQGNPDGVTADDRQDALLRLVAAKHWLDTVLVHELWFSLFPDCALAGGNNLAGGTHSAQQGGECG
ncbi:hypothetical protein [Paracraurococcus lichenis]|uniref:Uncharacterized protein n=1 Tax=Paracraurococcus lichenis TaxID=3064888 RepID=A0ABT9E952_9PROT|nr:hypothetical protein [Paracraurococcus sp. LOR1-02]MDO9712470.1 hypothetical protein [Paracraurococcus sp. LOR1-02]